MKIPYIEDSYFNKFPTKKDNSPSNIMRNAIRRYMKNLHELYLSAGEVNLVLEIGCGQGFVSGYLAEHHSNTSFMA